ncbi:MAG TPA: hypothetical protein VNV43_12435 [Candidatus Acidoferrales bacterium]|nr:hypothetical protein [Candidatus Acidoferrales bacterium]
MPKVSKFWLACVLWLIGLTGISAGVSSVTLNYDTGIRETLTYDGIQTSAVIDYDFGEVPTLQCERSSIGGKTGPFAAFAKFLAAETTALKPGSFSIADWSGYPAGVPKPAGQFRLIEGAEYDAARAAANQANNKIRIQQGLRGQPVDVHEIQPVKFGGSPTDPANKIILDRSLHRQQFLKFNLKN